MPTEGEPRKWSLTQLVAAGADPFERDLYGNPFLHLALATLDPDLVEAVVEAQYKVLNCDGKDRFMLARGADAQGRTPLVALLHALIGFDRSRQGYKVTIPAEDLVRLVAAAVGPYDRNRSTPWGRDHTTPAQFTPMHRAAQLSADLAVHVIQAMIKLGAPRDGRDDVEGQTALDMLEAREQTEGKSEGLTQMMDALRAAPIRTSDVPDFDDPNWPSLDAPV